MNINVNTPSKINLYLKITGKLPNGYHEIDTVFLPMNKPNDGITVTFLDDDGVIITSSSVAVPCDERNLCWKAVDAYSNAASISISCLVHIEKQIPIAAGMGGGSSDAAAVLTILNERFKLLDDAELARVALSLGADVPFFLKPQLSSATGVGEKLVPMNFDYPEIPILIIAPNFPVSAAWAYKHCRVASDSDVMGQMDDVLEAVRVGYFVRLAKLIRNDLATPLYNKFPILNIIKDSVIDAGALCCEVSGSGPTMFAICESHKKLQDTYTILQNSLPDSFTILM